VTHYIGRRLVYLVPVWLGISLLAYGLANLAPGDPAYIILRRQTGEVPSDAAVQVLRAQLGLNDPLPVRYGRWVIHAATGDLGTSYRTGEPVAQALASRFAATLQLALAALVLGTVIALPLGVLSAVRRNRPVDHISRVLALVGAAMPSFWLAYVLIIAFAVTLKALPVAGYGDVPHLILPALTLGLGAAASLSRLTRASLLEVLDEDFVRTARAKGLSERAAVLGHAVRAALIPIVTVVAMRFGHLLAGAVIVETVFAWPGVGKFVVDSIYDRDYPTIQGFVLFMGTVFVLLNLAVDISYVWLDPRVRLGGTQHGTRRAG
jgi:ABC-type dipeptide/oligopeptide/nickel transport system permease component